jgi:hypothetical protein
MLLYYLSIFEYSIMIKIKIKYFDLSQKLYDALIENNVKDIIMNSRTTMIDRWLTGSVSVTEPSV